MGQVRAAAVSDLPESGLMPCLVAGRKLVLVRTQGAVSAFEDRCAHLGLPVSGGRLENGVLICPAHEWEYDPRTGAGVNPRTACLKRVPVRIEQDQILVEDG
ncbi:MAG TPA: Rieske (2Fe-2S) protein [Planctomycetota bacterium]|nr:Rieske (2Fe-2S) protein [Planctomycetota bacterium]